MPKPVEWTRMNLVNPEGTRYISQVDFFEDVVTAEDCTAVINMLALDKHTTHSEIGLLAVLYGAALKGSVFPEIQCREGDLNALSHLKYVYPYMPDDGKLHVRLFMVGKSPKES